MKRALLNDVYAPATATVHYESKVEDAIFRKITLRLIPFLFICYVAAYLDRINIGFAQLQMRQDLGFSDFVYGLGAGIFFAGYFLFEVPSNLLLAKIGARKTLIRIMLAWGLISAGMMFVSSPLMFYVMRFLLGVAEAGFFPGMILYLTYWYPASQRGRVMAMFLTAVAVAGVVGGPLSGWAMNTLAGEHGLKGWQWMFLIEGFPSCALGIIAYFYLDDLPSKAKWLSDAEKATLIDCIKREQTGVDITKCQNFRDSIKDLRLYAFAFAWFTFICGVYVISFWLPTIIKGAGITDIFSIGLYAMIPYGIGAASMVIISRHSDRTLERRWHTASCALLGAVGLVLISLTAGTGLGRSLAALSFATAAIFTLQPLFWTIVTKYLGGSGAAPGGIALINSLGLIGGFVSPSILGWIKMTTGSLTIGLYFIAALLVIGAIVILLSAPKTRRGAF